MENKYTLDSKEILIEDIKKLQGYEGYIQFSDTEIRDCDIFQKNDVIATKLQATSGFVYEAHFWSEAEKKSIAIKQINSDWLVDEVENVPLSDTQVYFAKNNFKVKMAQIWEEEKDEHCEGMPVLKLKKVVFAGFEK